MAATTNGGQTPLEAIAITTRAALVTKNIFNGQATANEYTATNPYAISDNTSRVFGKGSGKFLDIENYAGVGGLLDVQGNQTATNGLGSGRNQALSLNGSTWGYGPTELGFQNYKAPNTSLNVGQVSI
jgi:hypothetical protein